MSVRDNSARVIVMPYGGSAFPVFAGNGNAETGEGKDSCHG